MAKVMEISVHFGKYLLPEEASIPVMATFMRLATMPSSGQHGTKIEGRAIGMNTAAKQQEHRHEEQKNLQ